MNIYRDRPKGTFNQEANWQELYILTQHWKKDLDFYKDDLRFLHRLIDKYFIWITEKENLDSVRKIGTNLLNISDKCKDLLHKISKHILQLGELVENSDKEQSRIFRLEHEHLEDEIAYFVKSYRENRKEVFTITEYVVDNEKLVHLLET
jgi:hypothetical protein